MKNKLILVTILLLLSFRCFSSIVINNGLLHERTSGPGTTYQQLIEIINTSDKEESVLIYQRDYLFHYTGKNDYEEPGSLARSNAPWIELSQSFIRLQPNERINVPIQVSVPADSSLNGSYWSMIMVEKFSPPDPNRSSGLQLRSVIRFGIQIVTHTGSGGSRDLKFLGTELQQFDSLLYFNVFLDNTGERMLRHTVSIELYDIDGYLAGTYFADATRTYPGTSLKSAIDISAVPAGTYSALLMADCDTDDIFGTNLTIEIPNYRFESLLEPKVQTFEGKTQLPIEYTKSRAKWGIQIAFSNSKPSLVNFKDIDNIIVCNCKAGYRVLAAIADEKEALSAYLKVIKNTGYHDAFITRIDTEHCECN